MKTTSLLDRADALEESAISSPDPGYALKVAVIYQDFLTRECARGVCSRVRRLVGEECISSTWWRIEELTQPDKLLPAVEAAMWADILIVSVHAKPELPADLHVWIGAWLPLRQHQPGALVALIHREAGISATSTLMYLQAVAQLSGLDFLPREQDPLESPVALEAESAPESIGLTKQALSQISNDAMEACSNGK